MPNYNEIILVQVCSYLVQLVFNEISCIVWLWCVATGMMCIGYPI